MGAYYIQGTLCIVLAALAGAALANLCSDRLMVPAYLSPVSDEMAEHINNLNTTWKAHNNFRGYSKRDLKVLMGTFLNADPNELPLKARSLSSGPLPDEFDARTEWPECANVIGHIRDQGACGSCWAHGAAEAITDRTCIYSGGKTNVLISADDLLSCCGLRCGLGCNGGFPGSAWRYWVRKGLVSGGDFGDFSTCRPYEIPPCEHHVPGPRPSCSGSEANTPKCVRSCADQFNGTYKDDRHFGSRAYSVPSHQDDIKRELLQGGSVEAAFTVYDDFPSYKSGVYQHHSNNYLGGHAVKIFGWGTENGTPFWLAANSWNSDWGDNGFFKILRGSNECGIEDGIVAGIPQ